MKYYAINGDTIAIADKVSALTKYYKNVQKLPDDYYERCYIVQGGKLVVDEPAEKAKAIEELDAQYNADKADVLTAYQTAQLYGDTDTMESLKADLTALDDQYDEDYERIVGGE